MVADPDKQAVYLAEDRLARLARRGAHDPAGGVVVGGRLVSVEPDLKFTALAQARLFCTLTCLEMGLPPVAVRLRRGEARSHYSARPAEIALASWGAWRLVVVHELAHHVVSTRHGPGLPDHGVAFRQAMLELLRHNGLPRQAEELASLFAASGLAPSVGESRGSQSHGEPES